ncbi:MAG: S8 family peptidase [Caldilineales bacterium]
MADTISAWAAQAAGQTIPVIVQFSSAETMRAFSESSVAAAATVDPGHRFGLIPAQAMSISAQDLEKLQALPYVEKVWEDKPVYVSLDVSAPHVHAPQMWNLGFDGSGVKVAVVDTGIDHSHPDFSDRILKTRDFTGSKPDAGDGHGHGTHVAGIIAGSGEASGGRYIGMAPQAQLLIAKALDDTGNGMTSTVMAGVDWAVTEGAQIINLSLGSLGPSDGTDPLSAICNAAVDNGVVVCVAAGNAGPNASTIGSPGCAVKVITVGATNDSDEMMAFSSRGPTGDGRAKPDICFPGFGIIAPRAHGTSMGSAIDTFYTSVSGTSMATPHASGIAAQLLEAFPGTSPGEIKRRFTATALSLGLEANTQGAGRGDARLAYENVPAQPDPTPTPTPTPLPAPDASGCSPLRASATGGSAGVFWLFLALFVLLCLCLVCLAAGLITFGLTTV